MESNDDRLRESGNHVLRLILNSRVRDKSIVLFVVWPFPSFSFLIAMEDPVTAPESAAAAAPPAATEAAPVEAAPVAEAQVAATEVCPCSIREL